MRRGPLSTLGSERGTVAIIVAIAAVVLFGAAALAIDAGNLWAARRGLITATDSSALAAADYLLRNGSTACNDAVNAGSGSGAGQEAQSYLTQNDASASLAASGFDVSPYNGDCGAGAGKVSVAAKRPATLNFAPAIGIGRSQSVKASSIAEWGRLLKTSGLRPIGVCDQYPAYRDWLSYGAAAGLDPDQNPGYRALAGTQPWYPAAGLYPGAGGDLISRILFQNLNGVTGCGSTSGNWGWISFNGSPSQSDLARWIQYGYGQLVDPSAVLQGSQGAKSATSSPLTTLLCAANVATQDCTTFGIVIYSSVNGPGHNVAFQGAAQLCVALRNFQPITGSSGWFDFELLVPSRCNFQGEVGVTNNPLALQGTTLCGADYAGTVDDRCAA